MSLVKKCVELDENIRKPLDIGLIWEGNYWDDQDVHDCCDVDWETIEILVRKIAIALLQPSSPIDPSANVLNRKIIIFLPRLIQLPLTILAAYRAGLVSIIMDPLVTSDDRLEEVLLCEKPELLVTVDAMWQAQELIEVKRRIENLRGMDDVQLLVIRHVAPNDGVPPPKKHFPARRPSYKTSLDLRNGKDLEWSTVMSGIKVEEDGSEKAKTEEEWKWKNDDVVMKLGDENGSLHIVHKVELLEALENRKSGLDAKFNGASVENLLVLDSPSDLGTLVNLMVPWFMGKCLTLYEGPLDYPDSSRLAQIIKKHSVDCLLGDRVAYQIPNPEYLKFFEIGNLPKFDDTCCSPKFQFR